MHHLVKGWLIPGPHPGAPSASAKPRRAAAAPRAAAASSVIVPAPLAPPRPAAVAPAPAAYQVPPGYQLVPTGAAPQAYQPPPGYVLNPIAPQTPAPVYAAPAPVPVAISPEQRRCAAILNSPEADGREALARHLALETGMPAAEAIAHLAAAHRGPSPVVASGAAGAAVARQALGLPADPAADLAVAQGVAAAFAGPVTVDALASAAFAADMAEGERTARALLRR